MKNSGNSMSHCNRCLAEFVGRFCAHHAIFFLKHSQRLQSKGKSADDMTGGYDKHTDSDDEEYAALVKKMSHIHVENEKDKQHETEFQLERGGKESSGSQSQGRDGGDSGSQAILIEAVTVVGENGKRMFSYPTSLDDRSLIHDIYMRECATLLRLNNTNKQ